MGVICNKRFSNMRHMQCKFYLMSVKLIERHYIHSMSVFYAMRVFFSMRTTS